MLGLAEQGFSMLSISPSTKLSSKEGYNLHASVGDMTRMLEVAAEHKVRSQLTIVPIDEGEILSEKSAKHDFKGKMVVMIQ